MHECAHGFELMRAFAAQVNKMRKSFISNDGRYRKDDEVTGAAVLEAMQNGRAHTLSVLLSTVRHRNACMCVCFRAVAG